MKTTNICLSLPFALATLIAGSLASLGAEAPPGTPSHAATAVENPVNYVLRVNWKSDNGRTNAIQLLTTEGKFNLEGTQPNALTVGGSELSISIRVEGSLKALSSQQGQLQLFLGRAVPFATRSGGPSGPPSIQQRQEGITVNFFVTFGQPVLIQKDGNGEISVLVERQSPQ